MTESTLLLKSSVHVNAPRILKVDKKELYVCVLWRKWNGLLQSRSKDFILKSYSWQLVIHRNIAHKLLLKQTKCFSNL